MTTIKISDLEREMQTLSPEHLTAAVEAVHRDGFVVLEDAVATEPLDVLRDKMIEDAHFLVSRPDAPFNWTAGNIQQDPPPFAPYLFADVLFNPFAVAVATEVLGPGFKNSAYTGNTALKSDARQPVHGDCGHLWKDIEVAHPTHCVVVNIPTVDVSPENGSTELWPGTHRDVTISAYGDIKIPAEAIEARRTIVPPIQPTLRRGAIVIRDMRMWHAGMPNHTDQPRPMVGLIWNAPWLEVPSGLRFRREDEAFFADAPVRQCAQFVDGEIDYLSAPQGFEYSAK